MTDLLTRAVAHAPTRAPALGAADGDAPASALSTSVAHDLALAVAPSTGRYRPAVAPGTQVRAGATLGHITGGGGRADAVAAPTSAAIEDLLVRPGQLVRRGEGLAWLRRLEGGVA